MKWLRTMVLFDKGEVISSADWQTVHSSYVQAIESIDHPVGSGTLTLREKVKLPGGQWQCNGVGYLRTRFLHSMRDVQGWRAEGSVDLSRDREQPPIRLYPSLESYREPITSDFGGFDFMTTAAGGTRIAIEWETGNISSSHRSMNKLAIALSSGIIEIGVLILPSRALYEREPLKTTVFIQCPAVFARNFRVCPFFEQIALFSGLFVPHSSRIGPLQAHLGL